VVYTQAGTWNSSGGGVQINGALIAEGSVAGNSNATLAYDAEILNRVRTTVGTFAMVPGSWRDF
jgi:hypothetical protein